MNFVPFLALSLYFMTMAEVMIIIMCGDDPAAARGSTRALIKFGQFAQCLPFDMPCVSVSYRHRDDLHDDIFAILS